jgi:guanylate kinase
MRIRYRYSRYVRYIKIKNVLLNKFFCSKGVKNLKKTNLNAIYCFIKTPNLNDLEKRLRSRGTETEESLRRRLDTAKIELDYEQSDKFAFDYVIINDDLENAYQKLKSILRQHVAQLKPTN